MGAEVARYLTSGLAVKHPCALILDILSRKVLKQGTAHTRHVVAHTILVSNRNIRWGANAGAGAYYQDRERQGSRDRAYKDVLAASPVSKHTPRRPQGRRSPKMVELMAPILPSSVCAGGLSTRPQDSRCHRHMRPQKRHAWLPQKSTGRYVLN